MTGAPEGDRPDKAQDGLKTIFLTERDIRAAARLLDLLVGAEDSRARETPSLAGGNVHRLRNEDRLARVKRAHQIYIDRARRSEVFKSVMFGEAAWDMLLALYIADESGARHTVTRLVNLSGAAPTTALRWLEFLENEQLVSRASKLSDRRVTLIELTDKARELLDTYFSVTTPEGE
jgi:DNA-binding MarR family transcriptional regulator